LAGVPVDGDVDYTLLAERTPGFSGADIASVVDEAKLIALRSQLSNEIEKGFGPIRPSPDTPPPAPGTEVAPQIVGVRMTDLLEAVGKTKSSVTVETLTWAEEFIKTYGTRG
ncbi:ATPase, AAA-type, core domain protein, partial [mine drainage metagenome]